ncbi:MAG TPA: hypothetical protein VLR26_17875 [Frankiaceae bacterium]|nr:hypothetical protein [Frankiaceae bacterium]
MSTSVAASVARPGQELAALAARSGLALALDRSELRARCSVGHDRRSPQSAVGVARDAASLWGTAYVLRGSALGNRYLHPLIAARLTDVPASAFRYLSASGAQTRREWNDFCRRLDEWSGPASPEELHRTGVAAAAAFALVGSVADRIGWPPATGLPADGAAS